jgi:hypothetical protein
MIDGQYREAKKPASFVAGLPGASDRENSQQMGNGRKSPNTGEAAAMKATGSHRARGRKADRELSLKNIGSGAPYHVAEPDAALLCGEDQVDHTEMTYGRGASAGAPGG